GGSLPETLAMVCAQRQIPAMALLDRNGVYGAPRFHLAAKMKDVGIKAHIGAEITVADALASMVTGTMANTVANTPPNLCSSALISGKGNYPLLVQSRSGYQNLCRLITTAKLRAGKKTVATVTLGELRWHAEGLICLTGDENGPLTL